MAAPRSIEERSAEYEPATLPDKVPRTEEIETHQKYLHNLIRLGEFFRPRIKNYGPGDLGKFGLERGMLLATIAELVS